MTEHPFPLLFVHSRNASISAVQDSLHSFVLPRNGYVLLQKSNRTGTPGVHDYKPVCSSQFRLDQANATNMPTSEGRVQLCVGMYASGWQYNTETPYWAPVPTREYVGYSFAINAGIIFADRTTGTKFLGAEGRVSSISCSGPTMFVLHYNDKDDYYLWVQVLRINLNPGPSPH
jgi:hypothetical protein